MTRDEYLAWAKKRALAYVAAGNVQEAFTSMSSDLQKHPDTRDHIGIELGLKLRMIGQLRTAQEMRDWINGFN